jgi:hypothetical protein
MKFLYTPIEAIMAADIGSVDFGGLSFDEGGGSSSFLSGTLLS